MLGHKHPFKIVDRHRIDVRPRLPLEGREHAFGVKPCDLSASTSRDLPWLQAATGPVGNFLGLAQNTGK
jgi:hypothetical protein